MGSQANPFVMIIEDDRENQVVFQAILSFNGFDAVICNDGITALEKLQSVTPHTIILDLRLPRLTGIEVFECISTCAHLKETRVIVVSADLETLDKINHPHKLSKPFKLAHLLRYLCLT